MCGLYGIIILLMLKYRRKMNFVIEINFAHVLDISWSYLNGVHVHSERCVSVLKRSKKTEQKFSLSVKSWRRWAWSRRGKVFNKKFRFRKQVFFCFWKEWRNSFIYYFGESCLSSQNSKYDAEHLWRKWNTFQTINYFKFYLWIN